MPPIDTESILDAVKNRLSANASHTAHALWGPACELWLNAEVRAALNEGDLVPKGCFVGGEERYPTPGDLRRPDILIHEIAEDRKTDYPCQVIEAKALYPWHNSRMKSQLLDLRKQLLAARKRLPHAAVLGLIYVVHIPAMRRDCPRPSYFYNIVEPMLQNVFKAKTYSLRSQRLQTIAEAIATNGRLPEGSHFESSVSFAMTYVVRR